MDEVKKPLVEVRVVRLQLESHFADPGPVNSLEMIQSAIGSLPRCVGFLENQIHRNKLLCCYCLSNGGNSREANKDGSLHEYLHGNGPQFHWQSLENGHHLCAVSHGRVTGKLNECLEFEAQLGPIHVIRVTFDGTLLTQCFACLCDLLVWFVVQDPVVANFVVIVVIVAMVVTTTATTTTALQPRQNTIAPSGSRLLPPLSTPPCV
mmetsp:Transcript_28728/g.69890  ORF Transcript_28728/g.69890 Transcript_28728/m.69890 type:complete len:207 (-) Transcript_28728:60-680(-)